MNSYDEFSEIFIAECEELIDSLDAVLFECDNSKALSNSSIDTAFRVVHTLKSSASAMGFFELSESAHALETILGHLKTNKNAIPEDETSQLTGLAFKFSEHYKAYIEAVANGDEPEDGKELSETLQSYAKAFEYTYGETENAKSASKAATAAATAPTGDGWLSVHIYLKKCPSSSMRAYVILKAVGALCEEAHTVPDCALKESDDEISEKGFEVWFKPKENVAADDIITAASSKAFFDRCDKVVTHNKKAVTAKKNTDSNLSVNKVYVSQDKLAELLNTAGELELLISQIEKRINSVFPGDFVTDQLIHNLKKSATAVTAGVSGISMIEIDSVFFNMKKLSRSMLDDIKKDVKVVFDGGGVMIDKSASDALSEALAHIIRNAIDHGIESSEERERYKKPPFGTVTVTASQQNGKVFVRVSDDGRGIDKSAVLKAAESRNMLLKPAEEYTNEETYSFLLKSGFTTKKDVSSYSGRGVGLDAAIKKIEAAGGRLKINSVSHQGTTFTIILPLLSSVTDVLDISIGKNEFLLPVSAIVKIIRDKSTLPYNNGDFTLSDTVYSLININDSDSCGSIILMKSMSKCTALVCSRIGKISSVLIKPFPAYAEKVMHSGGIFYGCSVFEDGSVRCILDAAHLDWNFSPRKDGVL